MDTKNNPHVNPLDLLTVPKVADLLSISEANLRRMIRRDEFPAVEIGRLIRISRPQLARWISSQEVPAHSRRELI